ncbi:MAG: Rieske 2Fe-2S domain-containing protein [Deltaproteobacteria bacterium]|nr:Rieske 2Fe-2S domain-containing protein [Deltaproteobacteria bacterium]MBW2100730.1 Rieske 2Fe-2S domain-containing protein [Deltaproteobacteria bacterium]
MSSNLKKIKDTAEPGRRSFLSKLWLGLGLVVFAESIGVVFAFLRPRKPRTSEGGFGSIITAGPVGDFEPNSVTAIVRGHFYLACLEDGGFLALSRKCTHLGCTVPWDSKNNQFTCPCHASVFDIKGNVISPPAPRALDIYPVTIENEIIKVDTRKPIRRSEFRPEQVMYAKRI